MSREIAALRSEVNGLTYPPYLRGDPTTVSEMASIGRILAELGHPPRIEGPAARRYLVAGARRYGSVTGRWLLLPFARDVRSYVADAAAIRRHRTPGGWFQDDPRAPQQTWPATTLRALEILRRTGRLTRQDVAASIGWVRSLVTNADPETRTVGAEAVAVLGQKPEILESDDRGPGRTDFRRLSQWQRSHLLDATDRYVRVRRAESLPAQVDIALWLHVFDANVDSLPPEDLFRVLSVLRGSGVAPVRLMSAARRFEADRLTDGLFMNPSGFVGDPRTTLQGLALRQLAGGGTRDVRIARQAITLRTKAALGSGADDLLVLEVIARSAGSAKYNRSLSVRCARSRVVDRQHAADWQFVALACKTAGYRVGQPKIVAWSTADPEGAVAAARLVNGLRDGTGRNDRPPSWIDRRALSSLLERPAALGNIGNVAEVARAVRYLEVDERAFLGSASAALITSARGCPGFPDLVRAVPSERYGCDLGTTLSARLLARTERPTTDQHGARSSS